MSRPRNRYEVGCPGCGLLDAFSTKREAFRYAISKERDHLECTGDIDVWDSMAHVGKVSTWEVRGATLWNAGRRGEVFGRVEKGLIQVRLKTTRLADTSTDTLSDAAMLMERPQTMNIYVRILPTTGFSSDMWPGPGCISFFAVFYPSDTLVYWYDGKWLTSNRTEYIEE